MRRISLFCVCAFVLASIAPFCRAQVDTKWKIHDPDRPAPPEIDPATASTQDSPGRPPSDAVVLFDGKDLSKWADKEGGPAKWKVENGYFEVVPKTGEIHTREPFGDCQLHVEFSEPSPAKGQPFDRGMILECWRHFGHLRWNLVPSDEDRYYENPKYAQLVRTRAASKASVTNRGVAFQTRVAPSSKAGD